MKYPIYKPFLDNKEKEYVNDCLDSTWISSKGKYVDLFELKIREITGAKYSIGVFNGTIALHLALLALGIKKGDKVIVPDFTYIASANAVKYVGATPVLVDINLEEWNISYEKIVECYTEDVKAIITTDIYGLPPKDMDKIRKFTKEKNIFLIEDSAESLGATYKDQKAGNLADIGIFSFFGNKTITTGEGGMLLTNDKTIYEIACQIKNQGNSIDKRYFHDVLGHNFRMTNIQAAIGCGQLEKLEYILNKKRDIYNWYKKYLGDKVCFQKIDKDIKSSYWMVSFLVDDKRDELMNFLEKEGIETRPFFYPVSDMPFYTKDRVNMVTQSISKKGMNVPSYPELKEVDIKYICDKILLFLEEN